MSFQDLESGRGLGSRRDYINGKQDPTQAVASGIFQINTAVSTFQRLVNTLGTPKDTPELREKLHKTRLHIGQLVKDTSAKLKQASETDHRVEVSASKKITDAKLAKDFQAVLKEFQKGQRLAAERETAYTPFVPQAVLPSRYAMEVQHFQVQLYLAIGFGLIFLVMNSNAMPTTDEEHKFCGEKYVTNTYFKKHDSLIDSQFEEFIANKIPLGLCKVLLDERYFMPRLLAVRRNLIGEGSHRQLSSSIRIKMQGESISKLPAQSCQIIIVEKLPSGVFADPFELQHLLHRGVFTDVTVLGDTNLELPSFRSNRSVVEIHLDMGYNMSSGGKDELEVNLGLPLHARYAPLGHGFSKVEFVQPDLFMRCGFEGKAFNGSCLFMPTNDDVDYKASPIVWEVPCGNKKHAGVVSAVTFLSAIVSALLIVSTSIYHSHNTIFQ